MNEPTTWIALYAAVLSTVGVHTLRKERRRLTVKCSFFLVPDPHSADILELVSISATNSSNRPVTLTGAGIHLTTWGAFVPLEHAIGPYPLPKKLEDGDRVSLLVSISIAKECLARAGTDARFTMAYVRDTEGKEYTVKVPGSVHQALGS